jgi:hypothetical protein
MIYKTLHRRTDNTIAKLKRTNNDRSTKHYTEGQTIQCSKEKGQTMIYKTLHRRTDNSMVKRKRTNNDLQNITQKDRQFNGQPKKDKQ